MAWVITVPAYFDDAQRQGNERRRAAGRLCMLRLLNEPMAAAIAYGLDQAKKALLLFTIRRRYLRYSIFTPEPRVFEVLATGGDSDARRRRLDHLPADYIREQAGIADRGDNRVVQRELLMPRLRRNRL